MAIIGSVYTSLCAAQLLHGAARHLPAHLLQVTQGSVGAGYAIAARVPESIHRAVLHSVTNSFMTGLHAGCLVAATVCVLGALGSGFLPGRRQDAPLPAAVATVRAA